MMETELSRPATKIVTELGGVEPTDQVLVLSDAETADIARALVTAARVISDDVHLLVKPTASEHSNEPSAVVAVALATADVAIMATRHALTHTNAVSEALDAGTQIVTLRSITKRMMLAGGITADLDQVREETTLVYELLRTGTTAHVTCPNGTDVTVGLTEHEPIAFAGPDGPNGQLVGYPPGESAIAPDERDATGTVVFDHSMDSIGLLDAPVKLEIVDGFVQSIDGGAQAQTLATLIEAADENAGHLAEFAIGTNSAALLDENLKEAKRHRGTAHFAIGDNASTLGGTLGSDLHLDGVIRWPTITIDGETVVRDGELLSEEIQSFLEAR
ncbi:aminopeptidase [Salinigranum halophilum]|uniref:aminopeptidase n=1 Tax=Salinigranum halophilum TaxID=2565931 RepID=UPI0013758708|nr:aminopeptidase [Salinigranum halophilum]